MEKSGLEGIIDDGFGYLPKNAKKVLGAGVLYVFLLGGVDSADAYGMMKKGLENPDYGAKQGIVLVYEGVSKPNLPGYKGNDVKPESLKGYDTEKRYANKR